MRHLRGRTVHRYPIDMPTVALPVLPAQPARPGVPLPGVLPGLVARSVSTPPGTPRDGIGCVLFCALGAVLVLVGSGVAAFGLVRGWWPL